MGRAGVGASGQGQELHFAYGEISKRHLLWKSMEFTGQV